MPIYEYRCENCGKVFEVRQKFVDEPLQTHEECGGKVERLVSAPAFNFKGSGWYVNDYAKGSKSETNGGSKNESSDKKDSTPASKDAAPASTSTSADKPSGSASSTDSKSSSS